MVHSLYTCIFYSIKLWGLCFETWDLWNKKRYYTSASLLSLYNVWVKYQIVIFSKKNAEGTHSLAYTVDQCVVSQQIFGVECFAQGESQQYFLKEWRLLPLYFKHPVSLSWTENICSQPYIHQPTSLTSRQVLPLFMNPLCHLFTDLLTASLAEEKKYRMVCLSC